MNNVVIHTGETTIVASKIVRYTPADAGIKMDLEGTKLNWIFLKDSDGKDLGRNDIDAAAKELAESVAYYAARPDSWAITWDAPNKSWTSRLIE